MPLFSYRCSDCGNVFELLIFGQKKPLCPACHSDKLERKYDGIRVGGKTCSEGGSCSGNCSGCHGCHH